MSINAKTQPQQALNVPPLPRSFSGHLPLPPEMHYVKYNQRAGPLQKPKNKLVNTKKNIITDTYKDPKTI